jgi:hypothetical protein
MVDETDKGFQPDRIAAVAARITEMIDARGGPGGQFAARMAELIRTGGKADDEDERQFLELAAELARLMRAAGLRVADP